MDNPYRIIKTVLITEKGTELTDEDKYTFKVAPDANKIEIAAAVEEIFDVTVSAVNTMNCHGKRKRFRFGRYGKRADWKKAIVTLSDGHIDLI